MPPASPTRLYGRTADECFPHGIIYGAAVDERKATTIATDKEITATIQKTFVEDGTIKVLDISSYCYDGNVFLVGEYDNM